MKKIMLIIILVIVLIALIIGLFFLKKDDTKPINSGDNVSGDIEFSSGDAFVPIIDKTYGNGTSYVSYKGNIYYIELLNSDFEDSTKTYDFRNEEPSSNSQRFMNVIHPNGTISNLFRISGVTDFYIFEDRFYFQKYNGMIHTTNMKGEDDKELGRGKFVCFDTMSHKVYYTLSNMKNKLWYMDMQTLEVGYNDYSNAYDSEEYTYLGYYNGFLYYYKIDQTYDNIMLVKHDLKENKDYNVVTEKINKTKDEKSYATEYLRYINVLNSSNDVLKYLSIGYLDGSGYFFTYGKLFEIDIEAEAITLITEELESENVNLIGNKLYYVEGNLESANIIEYNVDDTSKTKHSSDTSILGDKSLIYFDGVYSMIKQPFSEAIFKVAKKYGLSEKAFKQYVSGDLVDTYPYIAGYNDYDFFVSDVKVIGNNVFYTINIAKLDPTVEEHARGTIVPVYVRRANEVYLYNLESGNNTLVYAISNNGFVKEIKAIEDRIEQGIITSKEEKDNSNSGESISNPSTKLKSDETYIEIDTTNIWKNEFDVKVEEVGGTIFGKRIEYEGHHLKSEGKLKIKIKKEHNARLIIYIDNDIFSDTVMD